MSSREPYGLAPSFERAIVTLACRNQAFYSRIGHQLDTELLSDPIAQRALQMAQLIGKERGNGPTSFGIVTQRMTRLMQDGRVTQEQINEVIDMFDEALEHGLPSLEDAVGEMAPVLRIRKHDEAVQVAIEQLGKAGDMTSVADMIQEAAEIGNVKRTVGINYEDAFDEMAHISDVDRLSSGIPELDHALDGGPARGETCLFCGGAGDGKSMMLTQFAAQAACNGFNVSYATLEISRARTWARIIANVTGVPTNSVLNGSRHKALELWKELQPKLGKIRVEYFTGGATQIEDIFNFVEANEQTDGERYEITIIDYMDWVVLEEAKRKTPYQDAQAIGNKARVWNEQRGGWLLSASQAVRRAPGKRRRLDIDDGADSQHKVRVTDLWITLNTSADHSTIEMFVAKNRNGSSRGTTGPLPTAWEIARPAPVLREIGFTTTMSSLEALLNSTERRGLFE